MPNWKKVITSGSDAALNKLVVDGSIGHVSASLFSGSFYGDGSNLTGIAGGIFTQTGLIYATTNELEVSGSLVISQSSNGQAIDILNTGSRWRQYIDSNGHITLNASGSGANTNVNYTLEKGNFQLNLAEGHFNLDIDNTGKDFRIRDSSNATYFVVTGDKKVGIGQNVGVSPDQDVEIEGTVRLRDYGAGGKTGTLTYTLGVDSNGDIIETTGGSTTYTPDIYEIKPENTITANDTSLEIISTGAGGPTILDGTTGTERSSSDVHVVDFNSTGVFEITYTVNLSHGDPATDNRMNPAIYAKAGDAGGTLSEVHGSLNATYIRLPGSNQAPNGSIHGKFYYNNTTATDSLVLYLTFLGTTSNPDIDVVNHISGLRNTLTIRKIS